MKTDYEAESKRTDGVPIGINWPISDKNLAAMSSDEILSIFREAQTNREKQYDDTIALIRGLCPKYCRDIDRAVLRTHHHSLWLMVLAQALNAEIDIRKSHTDFLVKQAFS